MPRITPDLVQWIVAEDKVQYGSYSTVYTVLVLWYYVNITRYCKVGRTWYS
jgi:hypothetical protein